MATERAEPSVLARSPRTYAVATVAVLFLGFAARLGAARGQLWLDEIWSCEVARDMRGLGEIFLTIHDDNNHYLNTIWLMLVGDPSPFVSRGLALLSGMGTLLLVARNGLGIRALNHPIPERAVERLTIVTLFALSYILVHYDSEARGYAPLVFCSVASFYALDALLASGRWKFIGWFAVASVGGLLSHLTFLFPLAGFAVWAAVDSVFKTNRVARQIAYQRHNSVKLLAAFAPPILTFAVLWIVDIRHMIVRGGPQFEIFAVLRELLSATLGVPMGPLEMLFVPILLAAVWTCATLARRGDTRWAFFLTTLLIAPALVLKLRPPEYLAPRYFLACVPFLLLLVGTALSRSAPPGKRWRTAHAIVLAVFALASSFPIARLLREGRGHYREAILFMSKETAGPEVSFTSDHEFRNGLVAAYYIPSASNGKSFTYVDEDDSGNPPEWFLTHDFSQPPIAETSFTSARGARYELAKTFSYAGLSGWNWHLYRLGRRP